MERRSEERSDDREEGIASHQDELVKNFKDAYYKREKENDTDLIYQKDYLSQLASRYEEKDDWPSLLRAHTLYNSCAVRDKENREEWQNRAYQVQVKYWGTQLQSFSQHLQVAKALKQKLQQIREKRADETRKITQYFTQLNCEPGYLECSQNLQIYNKILLEVPELSNTVTRDMIGFTSAVIDSAIAICGLPVCKWCVVALGSLARGEATPYSDLEFLFLIESDEHVEWFERFALTIYFLIGNLCETNLRCMAISEFLSCDSQTKEVKYWFIDSAMSGFKIDGLGNKAGNIPTGNCSTKPQNHFICTVDKLAGRYKEVLDNPNLKESQSGDLSAMLAITVFITGDENLHDSLRHHISSYQPKPVRVLASLRMLVSDVSKFDFRPSNDLTHIRELKKDIYRYPSILILNLKILHNIKSCKPWEIIRVMEKQGNIAYLTANCIRFSFCCALIIRLSAYFHHNSQKESVSVLPYHSDDDSANDAWYVGPELLLHMFLHLMPLKEVLCELPSSTEKILVTRPTRQDKHEVVARTKYFCGDYGKVVSTLEAVYPDGVHLAKPHIQQVYIHSAIEHKMLDKASAVLDKRIQSQNYDQRDFYLQGRLFTDQGRVSDALESYQRQLGILISQQALTDIDDMDIMQSHRNIGVALRNLSKFTEAEEEYKKGWEIYQRKYGDKNHPVGAEILCNMGVVLRDLGKQEEALEMYNKSLNMRKRIHGHRENVQIADLIGNIGEILASQGNHADALKKYEKCLAMRKRIHKYRDHEDVADIHCNIGAVLMKEERYKEALEKHEMCLKMLRRIHGNGDHKKKTDVLNNLGMILRNQGKYKDALEHYEKCLAMRQRIYDDVKHHVQIADVLCNKGVVLRKLKKHIESEEAHRECLAMRKKIYGTEEHVDIADTLLNLGIILRDQQKYTEALRALSKCLEVMQKIFQNKDDVKIANVVRNIGLTLQRQKSYDEALNEYNKGLRIYRMKYGDSSHSKIADVLCEIGIIRKCQGQYPEALQTLNESLNMYIDVFGDVDHSDIIRVRKEISELKSEYGE